MIQRYNTLRVRFALWIAGLLVATLIGFGGFVYWRMVRSLSNSIDESLQLSAVQAIASSVDNGQISISDGVPEPFAITSLHEGGFTIRILRPDGTILKAVGLYSMLPTAASTLAAARNQQAAFETVIDPSEQEPIRFYTAPILSDNHVIAIIQVAQPLDSMNDTLEQLLVALVVGVPLLIAVAATGGYLLAARALFPIDAITRTAQRLSAQDLHQRLNLPRTEDEVGRLAATFDSMLARLDGAFQRERQFTADASHELRTPLTAMQIIIAVTREQRRSPEEYERVLDDFNDETQRLRKLIEDLLHLARSDVRTEMVFEAIDLSALLEDVSDVMMPLVEDKHLTLTREIANHLDMRGDSDYLIRLFMNLLDNAIKYTDVGSIKIQARPTSKGIEVILSDTGIGIPAVDLPRVFDRFYRVDSSRSAPGSGLGLSIASAIVQTHHGTIQVSSELGKNTVFTINLPTKPL